MELRSLGRTGVKVSSICLGTMMFGGRTHAEDSPAIIPPGDYVSSFSDADWAPRQYPLI